jgi:hypothetical protein
MVATLMDNGMDEAAAREKVALYLESKNPKVKAAPEVAPVAKASPEPRTDVQAGRVKAVDSMKPSPPEVRKMGGWTGEPAFTEYEVGNEPNLAYERAKADWAQTPAGKRAAAVEGGKTAVGELVDNKVAVAKTAIGGVAAAGRAVGEAIGDQASKVYADQLAAGKAFDAAERRRESAGGGAEPTPADFLVDRVRSAPLPPSPKKGIVENGNIDLTNRPHVWNPETGNYSSVLSGSYNIDGVETLLPHVSDDGRILSDDEAVAQYKKTGKHLGKFDSPEAATAYAKQLHEDQEKTMSPARARAELLRAGYTDEDLEGIDVVAFYEENAGG